MSHLKEALLEQVDLLVAFAECMVLDCINTSLSFINELVVLFQEFKLDQVHNQLRVIRLMLLIIIHAIFFN